jgi:hypothetical protein
MMRTPGLAVILLAACSSPEASLGIGWHKVVDTPPEEIRALDILFVIDDSGSMATDQYALVQAAGSELFEQLGDHLGVMPDLHVAVISTDLGSNAVGAGGCDAGDGGRFQVGGGACASIDGTFLVDVDDGAGGRITNYQGTLADTFACVARLGDVGCGFEHPLEAMRRALDGSNPENAGFLREQALLLVVFLTDEDDCSAFDRSVFDATDESIGGPLGPLTSFRCFEFGVACDADDPRAPGAREGCVPREDSAYIYPVQEYVDFLSTLKADPSMVMVAGIVPPAAPVAVEADVNGYPALAGACTPPPAPCPPEQPDCIRDPVAPAVRLDAVLHAFPSRYVLESICDDSMAAMLSRIARTATGVMAAEPCIIGDDLPASPSCRAYDQLAGGGRVAIPACGPEATSCFELVSDEQVCGHTPSHLRAEVRRTAAPPDGSHLVVECVGR